MDDQSPTTTTPTDIDVPVTSVPAPARSPFTRALGPTPRAAMHLAGAACLAVAAFILPAPVPTPVRTWSFPAAILLATAASAFAYRERRRCARSVKQLSSLLTDIRENRAAVEELSTADAGPLAPFVPHLTSILYDLKRQRSETAQLDVEMRQRVASRTDALERTLSSLKNQASRDPLTGLFNRRALDEHLPRLVNECRDEGSDLAILMIDLDHFKLVNDNLGHPAGDSLLTDVAKIIRSSVRDTDFPFRYGGDEFCILMPRTDAKSTQSVADRIASLGAQLGRTLRLLPCPKLSVGIAHLHGNPLATPDQLLEAADRALYSKKVHRKSA